MAQENVARNRALNLPAEQCAIEVTDRPVVEVATSDRRSFDVVVINVLLPVHRDLVVDVVACMADGATLITAGYLADQEAELLALYAEAGDLAVTERSAIDDWTAHRFTSP